ncbi:hypothetical protein [Campylobacter sp.]|uniref:hypothetical protein n=1 Tax=Campylobacter sp. TaxID=205 RepID=UPI002AA80D49|nr:hypothetical protein [Campylobacter sp.]MCI6660838.1 hypothetical protein [Campylobacter sp.]
MMRSSGQVGDDTRQVGMTQLWEFKFRNSRIPSGILRRNSSLRILFRNSSLGNSSLRNFSLGNSRIPRLFGG